MNSTPLTTVMTFNNALEFAFGADVAKQLWREKDSRQLHQLLTVYGNEVALGRKPEIALREVKIYFTVEASS